VAENVALPLKIGGEAASATEARVTDLLARVGLQDQGAKYPAQLSGGQKQRVGIARALATGPDILLCDEATSALDPETTHSILALIAELNRELGLTIVLITHEMEVVRQVCDRVAVLHAGRVVESGPVADVFLRPQAAETRAMIAVAGEDAPAIDFDGRVVRLMLRGDAVWQPVLTRIARETGTDFAILDGRIGRLKDDSFGQLTLGLSGGDVAAAVAALGRAGEVSA
jgi:D-methionine transport system ATP-binding protein